MTTFLIYAAALLVSFIVLVIVAFVYVIMNEDDKDDQHKPDLLTMTLKIFLDDKSFHCLKQSIPAGSRSKSIIEKAVHLDLFGGNFVLSCDEAEARNLLLYADHCPGVIASIHKAFRDAGLALTPSNVSVEGLTSPLRRRRVWRPST